MNHALVVSAIGLTGGFLLFLPFHLIGRIISSSYWALGQVFALAFFASILSLTSLYGSSLFTHVVLLSLVTLTTMQWKKVRSACQFALKRWASMLSNKEHLSANRIEHSVLIVSVLLLGVDLFWTSLPFYRYDQWNYHLSISKILANSWAPLPDAVFEDHIYFTGFYEYLFLLPRIFTNNDFYNQSISNVFSWLMYVSLSYGALKILLLEKQFQKRAFKLVGAAAILFCTPHREALSNAKPEALLIPLTMICLGLLHKIASHGGTQKVALPYAENKMTFRMLCLGFGFAMTAPLALKITWLHPAAALGIAFGLGILIEPRNSRTHAIGYTSVGVALGFVFSFVPLLKNHHFFGNPLHPFQGLYHSLRWSEFMAFHWERDNKPAHTFAEYINILKVLPGVWLSRLVWLIAASLPVIFRILLQKKQAFAVSVWFDQNSATNQQRKFAWLCVTAFCMFTFIWPFVGNPIIQPRYALSGLGIVFVSFFVFLGEKASHDFLRPYVYLGLLIPLLAQSKADSSLKSAFNIVSSPSLEAFYRLKGAPYDILELSQIINQDRKQRYIKATPYEHIAVTDTPMGYFLDSIRVRAPYYDYEYLRNTFYQTTGKQCLSAFLLSLKANYFIHYEKNFYPLPDEILELLKHATLLTGSDRRMPQAFHIETAALEQLRAQEPGCL